MDTFEEAIEYLWQECPRDMALSAHNITVNFKKKFKPTLVQKRFYGPYQKCFYPPEFDPQTHSLLLVGPPGIGKTQFARYLLGDCDYIKGNLDKVKQLQFDKPILFDEINTLNMDPEVSKELTDVENGGSWPMRYTNPEIPGGIARIFCSNIEFPFRNPNDAVYGRRVVTHRIDPWSQFVD